MGVGSGVPATEPGGSTADFYRNISQMLGADNLTFPAEYPPYGVEWDRLAKAGWEAGQPAFARVREARLIQHADWPASNPAGYGRGSYLSPIRGVANHLGDAAMYQHFQGDDAGAIDSIKDLSVISKLLQQKPWDSQARQLGGEAIRALRDYVLEVITSDVHLTSDAADHQKLRVSAARELIKELLVQDDPTVVWDASISSGQWDIPGTATASRKPCIETLNRVNVEDTFVAMSLACHLFFHDRGRWPESIDELVPGYLPRQSVDPWGDAHQVIGYVVVKGGLPDGADRPMVYSRCGWPGKIFYRVDEPQYGFYTDDGSNAGRPHHNPSGQFRDVASWVPTGGRAGPTTRSLE